MIVVTGGAGFIGSNLVHELNRRGHENVVVVDDLTDGKKFANIATAEIADYTRQIICHERKIALAQRDTVHRTGD